MATSALASVSPMGENLIHSRQQVHDLVNIAENKLYSKCAQSARVIRHAALGS
jgi:hypothetical protein